MRSMSAYEDPLPASRVMMRVGRRSAPRRTIATRSVVSMASSGPFTRSEYRGLYRGVAVVVSRSAMSRIRSCWGLASWLTFRTTIAARICGPVTARERQAFVTTNGKPRNVADVSPGNADAIRAMSAASRAESADVNPVIESTGNSAAWFDENPIAQSRDDAVSAASCSSRAIGHTRHESVRVLPTIVVMRAYPTRLPPANNSSWRARSTADSNRAESIALVSVNRGAMTNASRAVGPTMNSAGPAVESQVETSGGVTAVVSGGGATGTTVSFRPEAGGVRSQARTSAIESTTLLIGSVRTRRTYRGRSHRMSEICTVSLHRQSTRSRDECGRMVSLRHSTYGAEYGRTIASIVTGCVTHPLGA